MEAFSGWVLKRLLVTLAASAALGALLAPGAAAFGVFGVKQNGSSAFLSVSQDGGYVAWETPATNLSPDDPDTQFDVYVRNTQTGFTVLASRRSGATGAKGPGQARYPSLSADGRFVAFESTAPLSPDDTDGLSDVYVRDLQTDTTILASRETGPSGTKGSIDSYQPSISYDGRYVAFYSNARLSPSDLDQNGDVYVRDLQTDTTILASRATGVNGVKGNFSSINPSISGDGTRVSFGSFATNLGSDTDLTVDTFVRDLVANTTTLVSRATGASGAKGNGSSDMSALSEDGRYVAFQSAASNLSPDDTDTLIDVFLRDTVSNTTVLVSRASGAAGAKSTENSGSLVDRSITADGSRVSFYTRAALVPDDLDGNADIYVRDLSSNTTTLASRATGPSGASPSGAEVHSISPDGRYVAFGASNLDPDDTEFGTDVYIRDLQDEATYLESRGAPIYVRPKGASPLRVPLVPAFDECTAPNREHGPPLAHPSCNPPVQTSDYVTVGTPDWNGRILNFTGSVRLVAINDNPSSAADEANMKVQVTVTDMRSRPGLGDYTGDLDARLPLRLTDRSNGPSAAETGTTQDTDFRIPVPCTVTADTTIGSACSVNTSPNAIAPGAIKGGRRAIWALDQVRVYDGGADGAASTAGDNTLFAVQGVLVP